MLVAPPGGSDLTATGFVDAWRKLILTSTIQFRRLEVDPLFKVRDIFYGTFGKARASSRAVTEIVVKRLQVSAAPAAATAATAVSLIDDEETRNTYAYVGCSCHEFQSLVARSLRRWSWLPILYAA